MEQTSSKPICSSTRQDASLSVGQNAIWWRPSRPLSINSVYGDGAEFDAGVKARFAKVDTNGDGTVSDAERKAARDSMRAARQTMRDARQAD